MGRDEETQSEKTTYPLLTGRLSIKIQTIIKKKEKKQKKGRDEFPGSESKKHLKGMRQGLQSASSAEYTPSLALPSPQPSNLPQICLERVAAAG